MASQWPNDIAGQADRPVDIVRKDKQMDGGVLTKKRPTLERCSCATAATWADVDEQPPCKACAGSWHELPSSKSGRATGQSQRIGQSRDIGSKCSSGGKRSAASQPPATAAAAQPPVMAASGKTQGVPSAPGINSLDTHALNGRLGDRHQKASGCPLPRVRVRVNSSVPLATVACSARIPFQCVGAEGGALVTDCIGSGCEYIQRVAYARALGMHATDTRGEARYTRPRYLGSS